MDDVARALPIEEWPEGGGDHPVAHLAPTASELSRDSVVSFHDVDGELMAAVALPEGVAWLVDLPGGRAGTTVMGPARPHDASQLVRSLLGFLGLDNDAVEWCRWDSL